MTANTTAGMTTAMTDLIACVRKDDTHACDRLLHSLADGDASNPTVFLNQPLERGVTALHVAAAANSTKTAALLLERGARVDPVCSLKLHGHKIILDEALEGRQLHRIINSGWLGFLIYASITMIYLGCVSLVAIPFLSVWDKMLDIESEFFNMVFNHGFRLFLGTGCLLYPLCTFLYPQLRRDILFAYNSGRRLGEANSRKGLVSKLHVMFLGFCASSLSALGFALVGSDSTFRLGCLITWVITSSGSVLLLFVNRKIIRGERYAFKQCWRAAGLWTPLHIAAALGHSDIVQILLANGAARSATTAAGATPRKLATMTGTMPSVVRML